MSLSSQANSNINLPKTTWDRSNHKVVKDQQDSSKLFLNNNRKFESAEEKRDEKEAEKKRKESSAEEKREERSADENREERSAEEKRKESSAEEKREESSAEEKREESSAEEKQKVRSDEGKQKVRSAEGKQKVKSAEGKQKVKIAEGKQRKKEKGKDLTNEPNFSAKSSVSRQRSPTFVFTNNSDYQNKEINTKISKKKLKQMIKFLTVTARELNNRENKRDSINLVKLIQMFGHDDVTKKVCKDELKVLFDEIRKKQLEKGIKPNTNIEVSPKIVGPHFQKHEIIKMHKTIVEQTNKSYSIPKTSNSEEEAFYNFNSIEIFGYQNTLSKLFEKLYGNGRQGRYDSEPNIIPETTERAKISELLQRIFI